MNPQVEERACLSTHSLEHRAPVKVIQLDASQAKRWAEYLKCLPLGDRVAPIVGDFQSKLDDALWLANWKREYVVIELELTIVPTLIAAVTGYEPNTSSQRSLDTREDILAVLSKMPGWT